MSSQIIIVLILNFIISLIGTLAYSVRMVGVRTGKIAVSFAVFNILSLVSRMAVTFQIPLLTKYVEHNSDSNDLLHIFNVIILVSGIATIVGAFLIPTFQRIFYKGVLNFSVERSIPKLVIHSFSKAGVNYIKDCVAIPVKENITGLNLRKLPIKIIIYNLIAVALLTVGALAPIYAGSIAPDLRATCVTLSSIINGVATILMSILIDPQLSVMTDDVIEGNCTEEDFRAVVIGMVGSKTLGTFASLLLIIPASYLIVFIAKVI
ncbi:lipid II flippase Amj family protein [Bacillus tuaregi]|uniref:lipid II flippase Amj family protein n=1 Tax=Bacillus tuaregi TaxID=1816695 RepID=UPI0008F92E7D|nr:lipid II flippase Amj family protein [Bacillus tuaregi]